MWNKKLFIWIKKEHYRNVTTVLLVIINITGVYDLLKPTAREYEILCVIGRFTE